MIKAALFDLDGVLVDTAKYHYLAWQRLAQELGFHFTLEQNERLKGVNRMRSLEIVLEVGGLTLPEDEMLVLAAKKNAWYVEMLDTLTQGDLLPGALDTLVGFRSRGVKTALGSASKNSPMILDKLGIADYFDTIIDGNKTQRAKPDPEVFLLGAKALGVAPAHCVVFEDAYAGIEAALAGGMLAVGVGERRNLPNAQEIVRDLSELNVDDLLARYGEGGA